MCIFIYTDCLVLMQPVKIAHIGVLNTSFSRHLKNMYSIDVAKDQGAKRIIIHLQLFESLSGSRCPRI